MLVRVTEPVGYAAGVGSKPPSLCLLLSDYPAVVGTWVTSESLLLWLACEGPDVGWRSLRAPCWS